MNQRRRDHLQQISRDIRRRIHPSTSLRMRPQPAGMGYQCDNVFYNPAFTPDGDAPLLIRCHARATRRIVINDVTDCYAVKRCPACVDILHAQVKAGVFEILSEEAI
jgi:hypothetical protein